MHEIKQSDYEYKCAGYSETFEVEETDLVGLAVEAVDIEGGGGTSDEESDACIVQTDQPLVGFEVEGTEEVEGG